MEKNIVENNKSFKPIFVQDEMSSSYLSYAMSVIVSRALPDVRDGLKPVHRRIIYAMYKGGYDWSKPFRKSARIVGDVIGKYHPHGDQSVYDALVRMVQDFSMSLPLVEGQGNFGDSISVNFYINEDLSSKKPLLLDSIISGSDELCGVTRWEDITMGNTTICQSTKKYYVRNLSRNNQTMEWNLLW